MVKIEPQPDHLKRTMLKTFASIPKSVGSANSYFMPISIENHYYSRNRVREIAQLFLETADASVVVPCDRLRFLSYLTHKGISEKEATRKAEDECMNVLKMLDNAGIPQIGSCHVAPMSAFYTDPGLDLFVNEFSKMVDSCPSARGKLEALTDFYLDKFYEPTDRHEQSRTMLRMNVIHAAGFGIYVTEKLGYRKEIYKDKSGLLQTYLYKENSDLLAKVLGKDHLEREFIELTPLLP